MYLKTHFLCCVSFWYDGLLKVNWVYRLLIISIFISTFLGYVFNSGAIAYSPIIISLFLILLTEIRQKTFFLAEDWISVLLFSFYSIVAGFYYVISPYSGKFLTTHFLIILMLPFLVLSLVRLGYYTPSFDSVKFRSKLILSFLFLQLVICIGQVATYTLGFGLPISEEYQGFFGITGTFINPNDLACIVLLITYIFIGLKNNLHHLTRKLGWGFIVVLLLLTGSRSALVLAFLLFVISQKYTLKTIFYIFFSIVSLVFLYQTFSNRDDGVIGRVIARVDSILQVLAGGMGKDSSMSIRAESYLHFIDRFTELGTGSGKIANYFMYANNVNFNPELMFQNPHSLIVELGYWLGWLGLFLFLVATGYLLRYSNRKLQVIGVFVVSSMISSSVLGSLIFFLFFLFTFFDKSKIYNETLYLTKGS